MEIILTGENNALVYVLNVHLVVLRFDTSARVEEAGRQGSAR